MELLRQVCIKIVLPVERGEGRNFDGSKLSKWEKNTA